MIALQLWYSLFLKFGWNFWDLAGQTSENRFTSATSRCAVVLSRARARRRVASTPRRRSGPPSARVSWDHHAIITHSSLWPPRSANRASRYVLCAGAAAAELCLRHPPAGVPCACRGRALLCSRFWFATKACSPTHRSPPIKGHCCVSSGVPVASPLSPS
jgi:hypothetical protein